MQMWDEDDEEQFGPLFAQVVPQGADTAVQNKAFDGDVGRAKDGHGWTVISTMALETNEPVFENIDTSNAMILPRALRQIEELEGFRDGLYGVIT
ncbi:hypothetical protein E4U41_001649 [Claviceps citrina]|nr:hypothetical protein E4U41_001649 [Claviceps citrina]